MTQTKHATSSKALYEQDGFWTGKNSENSSKRDLSDLWASSIIIKKALLLYGMKTYSGSPNDGLQRHELWEETSEI